MTQPGSRTADAPRAVVAVGGSAGALVPLVDLVSRLPADLDVAFLVVMHTGDRTPSKLPDILGRATAFGVASARDGEAVVRGRVYVAPPGRHLMVWDGKIVLSAGPRVNRHRPAIDVTLASVANWATSHAVAVVLSGVLDDGAVGAALVARAGGSVLVQDPESADFSSMPKAALAANPGARTAPDDELAALLTGTLTKLLLTAGPLDEGHRTETKESSMTDVSMEDSADPGFLFSGETRLSRLTCPDCSGTMAEVDLDNIRYFRCHVGHQFSPQTLSAAQAETAERRLWLAVASLEEQANVLRYLAATLSVPADAAANADEADQIARRAAALRERVRQWSDLPETDVSRA